MMKIAAFSRYRNRQECRAWSRGHQSSRTNLDPRQPAVSAASRAVDSRSGYDEFDSVLNDQRGMVDECLDHTHRIYYYSAEPGLKNLWCYCPSSSQFRGAMEEIAGARRSTNLFRLKRHGKVGVRWYSQEKLHDVDEKRNYWLCHLRWKPLDC